MIAIIIFMGFIFVLVYQSAQNDINLVEKDYYPKGLKYQDRIDEITNAQPLKQLFKITPFEDELLVSFPPIHPDAGTIVFFRPSGTDFDRTYQIELDSLYQMQLSKSNFIKGKYLVKIFWRENDKSYYLEQPYYFN